MGKTHLTRRELIKQDEFLVGVNETWEFFRVHGRDILIGVGAVLVVAAASYGIFWYFRNRDVVSNEDISKAIQLYNSPLVNEKPSTPLGANQRVFATAQEKYSTAEKEFARLSRKYSGKPIGETAVYYDGLCKNQLGDTAGAVQQLQSITRNVQHSEIAALAKLSLAQIYAAQKNTSQVVALLQQLIDHPTDTVPKVSAMMALAEYYQEIDNKDAAIQLYKKIQTEFPTSQILGDVRSRLTELGASS